MRRIRVLAVVSAIVAMAGTARPDVPLGGVLQILGSVTNAARPVANVLVIALNLGDFEAFQTFSTTDGSFTLPPLRAGIYKIIAVKQGFAPAMTVVVPNRSSQRLALKLENEKSAKGKSANQEIWEIRGSLPPDVLRELDQVLADPTRLTVDDLPRFKGEMVSMTGVSGDTATGPAFAQTALGMQSRIGEKWQLGFRGNLHRVEDPNDDSRFGTPLAQSSVMSMELRSSPTDSYRVASAQSWWRYRDDVPGTVDHQADVRSHNFEWDHGDAHVAVRYLAQQNLFTSSPLGSDLIEIAGNTTVLQTRRNDIGVSLRVTQENLRNAGATTMRTADVTANGSVELVPSVLVHYGMSSRLGIQGSEWAPRTGAEIKIAKDTAFIVSAMYKVLNQTTADALPTLEVSDESRSLPRYAYSFGFVSGDESSNRLSAIATISEVDAPLRLVFANGYDQFWDGVYVDAGDVRRDLRVAYRREIGRHFAVDVSTSAGTAQNRNMPGEKQKIYVTGDVESTFTPTGTSLAVSYREIQQPQATDDYHSERVNVRMAQSLHLPLDMKLLLGIELAHAQNSPFLLDLADRDGASRKYIGGLAVNF